MRVTPTTIVTVVMLTSFQPCSVSEYIHTTVVGGNLKPYLLVQRALKQGVGLHGLAFFVKPKPLQTMELFHKNKCLMHM